jgi:CNT family concentrative nucleoside transporter
MEDKKLIFQSIAGLIVFAVIAWSMSENRRQIKLKVAVTGIVIQLLVGLILLKLPLFRDFFLLLNRVVLSLEEATTAGTSFVFGYLGGGELPY